MKFSDSQIAIGAAILLLSIPSQASHSHLEALEKRHSHHHHKKAHTSPRVEGLGEVVQDLKKRGGSCKFPTDAGLVAVTPGSLNAGWAQSPDMACKPGHYCPYACPAGQLMAQWSPTATSYVYPDSQYGGLYCDADGEISKPFPNKPYCYDGVGTVAVKNTCGKVHAVCQTVLPGYEDMLIPTEVDSSAVLAVPGMDYWASTASHFYHNEPGVSTSEGCVWGDGSKPIGNWAPYVSGANQDANGNTFVKIAWNPIWLASDFAKTAPNWGLKITCVPEGACNGTPCSIDPSVNKVNEVTSNESSSGAGGGDFCVVTAAKGAMAYITVFNAGDSSSSGSNHVAAASAPSLSPSTSNKPSPTPTPTPTPTPSPSSSSLKSSSSSSSSSSIKSSSSSSSTSSSSTTSLLPSNSNAPHVLFENYTSTANTSSTPMTSVISYFSSASAVMTAPSVPAPTKNTAPGAMISSETMGLSVLLAIAVTYLL